MNFSRLIGRLRGKLKNFLGIKEDDRGYYTRLFIHNPDWNNRSPNQDEKDRWQAIRGLIQEHGPGSPDAIILDAGCGRGWLTALLSEFGHVHGIDPVPDVIDYARTLFPNLRFSAGDLETLTQQKHYDLVVSSEVIEHIDDKLHFLGLVRGLLRNNGYLVLSTPRGELQEQWIARFGNPSQPREEWLTTEECVGLLTRAGFSVQASRTASVMDIYQVHIAVAAA